MAEPTINVIKPQLIEAGVPSRKAGRVARMLEEVLEEELFSYLTVGMSEMELSELDSYLETHSKEELLERIGINEEILNEKAEEILNTYLEKLIQNIEQINSSDRT